MASLTPACSAMSDSRARGFSLTTVSLWPTNVALVKGCSRATHRKPRRARARLPAVEHSPGGVARGPRGRPAAGHLPAHRPLRPHQRGRVRGQGGRGALRDAGVRAALRPGAPRPADRRADRRGAGPEHRRRRAAARRPHHPAPGVLPPLPRPVLVQPATRDRAPAARRAGGPARPAAPRRLLLERLLAVQHPLPARRRGLRRLPRRRRDRRAAPVAHERPAHLRPGDRGDQRGRRAHGPAGRGPTPRGHRPHRHRASACAPGTTSSGTRSPVRSSSRARTAIRSRPGSGA